MLALNLTTLMLFGGLLLLCSMINLLIGVGLLVLKKWPAGEHLIKAAIGLFGAGMFCLLAAQLASAT